MIETFDVGSTRLIAVIDNWTRGHAPFMTIYLNRQYGLGVDLIGYALTSALTIGVIFSLGFGILADKFDKKRYMLLAIIAFACGFIAIPMVHNVVLVVLLFALINCAYSVFLPS